MLFPELLFKMKSENFQLAFPQLHICYVTELQYE